MFMILNRHNEILARDGEFYPVQSIDQPGARVFPTEAEAITASNLIRDYTKVAEYALQAVRYTKDIRNAS